LAGNRDGLMEIIAEIGQNHNGNMDLAIELIHSAKENGADVAKFQVYDAKKLFPKENNPWYEYNCMTELSRDQVFILADECRNTGIEFLASVFDVERVGWLEDAGVKRYKIASRSINDSELIAAIAETGKPVIVSLGLWKGQDFPDLGFKQAVKYLYCISKYPVSLSELHLGSVDFTRYNGFSDHSIGITASLVALSRGAEIIEKHFTIDKKMFGPDHSLSMDANDLRTMSNFRDELRLCL
jgi:N-acetylneuraminate synthase/N,N'-diacetyllegionaminate synthase